jgi:hypothetical protein
MFSFSVITIQQIYPDNPESPWLIYNRPLDEDKYSSRIETNIPITIFDSVENKNDFGVMKIELFSK